MTLRLATTPTLLLTVAGLFLAACSSGGDSNDTAASAALTQAPALVTRSPVSPTTPSGPALTGSLTIFAAASLQGTFTDIGNQIMAANPGLTITFNFGSSGTLSQQLISGAPADVFASANEEMMKDASPVVAESSLFAHNSLVIAVPKGNPAGVKGLRDFTNADLKLALCDPSAPCGSAAQKIFQRAGLTPAPDTLGQDAKATLNLVAAGEVDAALVYKTDAIAAGNTVETITFPEASSVINDYPIATLKDTKNPAAARVFIDDVLSPAGQKILTDAGFDPA